MCCCCSCAWWCYIPLHKDVVVAASWYATQADMLKRTSLWPLQEKELQQLRSQLRRLELDNEGLRWVAAGLWGVGGWQGEICLCSWVHLHGAGACTAGQVLGQRGVVQGAAPCPALCVRCIRLQVLLVHSALCGGASQGCGAWHGSLWQVSCCLKKGCGEMSWCCCC